MQSHKDVVRGDVTVDEGDLFVTAVVIEVADRLEFPVHGGQRGIHDAFHAGALWCLLAEDANFICHDLFPKQRRKAVKR
jgi:hypothetical protein